MTIRRKGAAPWSVDYEAGLADAPVSSHPGVEADQIKAVIDAGFIDANGTWNIDRPVNDTFFQIHEFAFALAPGVSVRTLNLDMTNHDILFSVIWTRAVTMLILTYPIISRIVQLEPLIN